MFAPCGCMGVAYILHRRKQKRSIATYAQNATKKLVRDTWISEEVGDSELSVEWFIFSPFTGRCSGSRGLNLIFNFRGAIWTGTFSGNCSFSFWAISPSMISITNFAFDPPKLFTKTVIECNNACLLTIHGTNDWLEAIFVVTVQNWAKRKAKQQRKLLEAVPWQQGVKIIIYHVRGDYVSVIMCTGLPANGWSCLVAEKAGYFSSLTNIKLLEAGVDDKTTWEFRSSKWNFWEVQSMFFCWLSLEIATSLTSHRWKNWNCPAVVAWGTERKSPCWGGQRFDPGSCFNQKGIFLVAGEGSMMWVEVIFM